MSFTPRLNVDGIRSSNFWIGKNSGGYNPYDGEYNPITTPSIVGNCTWYAWGRSAEIAGFNIESEFPKYGDAVYWFNATSWDKDNGANLYERVQLGDILCFSGLVHGHVEVVEQITDSQIITSSSAYYYDGTGQSEYFFRTSPNVKAGYYPKTSVVVGARSDLSASHSLQGIIHNPYAGETPTTASLSYSVQPSGYGSISGTSQGTYDIGKSVTLTAKAHTGHTFTGWSDGDTSATKSFTLEHDTNLIAYFDEEPPTTQYYLSYSVSPEGSGYITGDDEGYYDAGTEITIEAHANNGWVFDHWEGRSIDYNNPKTETMNRDRSYTAYFVEDPVTIIACQATIKKRKGEIHEITILI